MIEAYVILAAIVGVILGLCFFVAGMWLLFSEKRISLETKIAVLIACTIVCLLIFVATVIWWC